MCFKSYERYIHAHLYGSNKLTLYNRIFKICTHTTSHVGVPSTFDLQQMVNQKQQLHAYHIEYFSVGQGSGDRVSEIGKHCVGYQKSCVTPCTHILGLHVAGYIKDSSNIKQFGCQGKPSSYRYVIMYIQLQRTTYIQYILWLTLNVMISSQIQLLSLTYYVGIERNNDDAKNMCFRYSN